MAKSKKARKKDKFTLQDTIKRGKKRNEHQELTTKSRTRTRNISRRQRSAHAAEPEGVKQVNQRGLPALPDELLLEIISYLPSSIPKISSMVTRDSIGSGFVRREVLLCLSLLCRNLRRFFMPYVFETIEVCVGTRVDRGVKAKSIVLGGSPDNYTVNKEFAVEVMRQLHFVTKKHPELRDKVRAVSVELRGHRLEEVSEELFRSLPLFPNLNVVRLQVNFPASYHDVRHCSKAQIDPALYDGISLPSVHTLITDAHFHKFVTVCPNLKHLRSGHNDVPIHHLQISYQHASIETLYIGRVVPELVQFINLRKLVISEDWLNGHDTVLSHDMLHLIGYPRLPCLQALQIVITFRLGRKMDIGPLLERLETELRQRQLSVREDKYICVEYQSPRLKRDYVQLKVDGTRETDAKLIRDMFWQI